MPARIFLNLGAVATLAVPVAAQDVVVDSLPRLRISWELVRVPGGEVQVPGKAGPVTVRVESFLIGRTEVPWELYDIYALRLDVPRDQRAHVDAVTRPSNPYGAPDHGFGHRGFPTLSVTHAATVRFAAWLSERTGHRYTVATDAQWQRAADLAFAAPSAADLDSRTWHAGNAGGTTHPVATRAPDRLGLHDLLGNAGEWVTGMDSVPWLRGGSYLTPREALTPTLRERQVPSWNRTDPQDPKSRWWLSDGTFVGFRLVRLP